MRLMMSEHTTEALLNPPQNTHTTTFQTILNCSTFYFHSHNIFLLYVFNCLSIESMGYNERTHFASKDAARLNFAFLQLIEPNDDKNVQDCIHFSIFFFSFARFLFFFYLFGKPPTAHYF